VHVIALHVRDLRTERAHLLRERGRRKAAGVRDDLDPALEARREHVVELAQERARVAVLGARQDRHRQLRQICRL